MTPLSLPQRILELERVLAAIPHAFGGAIALAYYAEPRATIDIDLHLVIPVARFQEVATPLLDLGVSIEDHVGELVRRDGQARVMWNETPVDLFFAYDSFHDAAARSRRTVPFADASISILAAEHLIVCKAIFSRSKDWVDIDAMLAAHVDLDVAEILRWVSRIAGDQDPRFDRLAAVLTKR